HLWQTVTVLTINGHDPGGAKGQHDYVCEAANTFHAARQSRRSGDSDRHRSHGEAWGKSVTEKTVLQ
ncbi:MAG: hypothetical protein KDC65_17610, partial [Saprospiraceae bacterium]|nr:hypothetical protein [Saprospiraceae bacterium]